MPEHHCCSSWPAFSKQPLMVKKKEVCVCGGGGLALAKGETTDDWNETVTSELWVYMLVVFTCGCRWLFACWSVSWSLTPAGHPVSAMTDAFTVEFQLDYWRLLTLMEQALMCVWVFFFFLDRMSSGVTEQRRNPALSLVTNTFQASTETVHDQFIHPHSCPLWFTELVPLHWATFGSLSCVQLCVTLSQVFSSSPNASD